MIGNLRTPFSKSDIILDGLYLLTFGLHQIEGENIINDLPVYKSGEIMAFFTDKRIVFSCKPDQFGSFDKSSGFEFLPYKSIRRFALFSDHLARNYTLDIVVSDNVTIPFYLSDSHEATKISRLIGKHSV